MEEDGEEGGNEQKVIGMRGEGSAISAKQLVYDFWLDGDKCWEEKEPKEIGLAGIGSDVLLGTRTGEKKGVLVLDNVLSTTQSGALEDKDGLASIIGCKKVLVASVESLGFTEKDSRKVNTMGWMYGSSWGSIYL